MPPETPRDGQNADASAPVAIDASRREPFGKSPDVGTRGLATQKRLLGAALTLFGEIGYPRTSVEAITDLAGCSRPTFYQYFESKEDLFRRLAGRLGATLAELTEDLGPVDASPAGVAEIRSWFEQLLEVHDSYRPIALAFAASLARDEQMSSGARLLADRYARGLAGALVDPLATPVAITPLAGLVMITAFGTCNYASRDGRGFDRGRLADGIAAIAHRTFFGCLEGINSFPPRKTRSRVAAPAPLRLPGPRDDKLRPKGAATRARLVESAVLVFSERGYFDTRVDDIVEAASLSHGAFYRYFDDKQAVFAEIVLAASSDLLELMGELPAPPGGLAEWCRRYYRTYERHGALFSTWAEATEAGVDAAGQVGQAVTSALQAALDGRGFGDVAVDGLFLFALLENGPQATIGYGALTTDEAVAATALVLERAILEPYTPTTYDNHDSDPQGEPA